MTRKHSHSKQCSFLKTSPLTTSCKRCCGCDCGSETRRCHSVATKHIHFVFWIPRCQKVGHRFDAKTYSEYALPRKSSRGVNKVDIIFEFFCVVLVHLYLGMYHTDNSAKRDGALSSVWQDLLQNKYDMAVALTNG